jgi:hypothetical protein
VPYARSETHLTELFETVCDEMENYSNFVENGKTIYKRSACKVTNCRFIYFPFSDMVCLPLSLSLPPPPPCLFWLACFVRRYQKRPGDEGTLNLTNFGWSVDVQKELRLACDAILAEIEDDVMSYYQGEKDLHVPAATKFCPRWCEDRDSDEL